MDGKEKTKFRETAFQEVFEKARLSDKQFKLKKGVFTRTSGDFIDSIGYGSSSRSNTLEDTNMIVIKASTVHRKFKEFQNNVLDLTFLEGQIGGGHIENLFQEPPPYITYDIGVSENQKTIAVTNIVSAIEVQALPFFDVTRDISKIIENSNIPAFIPERLFEYCIFSDKKELIPSIIENLINKTPELKTHLKNYLSLIEKGEIEKVESEKTLSDHVKTRSKSLAIRINELNINELCMTVF